MANLKKAGVASRNIVIKKQDLRPRFCSYFLYHQHSHNSSHRAKAEYNKCAEE